jgi:hypothetical protein
VCRSVLTTPLVCGSQASVTSSIFISTCTVHQPHDSPVKTALARDARHAAVTV